MADIENKINKEWVTKALGNVNLSADQKIDESLLEEEAVILLQGTNMFGDSIFSYTKITLRNFRALRDAMLAGTDFKPSDFGEVVAAGRGEPSQELRDEMMVKYKMVDVPKRQAANQRPAQAPNTYAPKFFGSDDV